MNVDIMEMQNFHKITFLSAAPNQILKYTLHIFAKYRIILFCKHDVGKLYL